MRSYGPTYWLYNYDTQVILCAGYYTSHCIQLESKPPDALCWTLPSTLWSTLLIALDCTLLACLTILYQLLPIEHSRPAWLILPSKPPSMFSSTLQGTLSKTLPIAHDGTLAGCLTVYSQVSSRDTLKHTPNCTRWHTPSLLEYLLPSKHSRYS